MRLRQALGSNEVVGVVGLPGIETWNAGMGKDLGNTKQVWTILDNDLDYKVAGRVDEAWRTIRSDLGPRAKRILLPRGVNDVCEFFEFHSLDALRNLVDRVPQPGDSRYQVLDLTAPPVPPHYIVDRMICRGDIHLFIGEPKIGKSWIAMGLAQAVANGDTTFLGRNVLEHGRVLYFDEENPQDMVLFRFNQLGLNTESAKNIRYISNASVRLDHDPTSVLDEVMDFDPILIIMDSLTRFHGQDENNAGAMAELFNTGIKPLARQSGAGLVMIHHAGKIESSSSYKRARGSGDIVASADSGYDFRQLDEGALSIVNSHSRRHSQGSMMLVSIVDRPDGSVAFLTRDGGF